MGYKLKIIRGFVENFIKNKIEPKGFVYHNLAHTLSVVQRSEYLAKKENLSKHLIEKIKIASYFHDLGLRVGEYKDHEIRSAEIFKNFNREYKFFSLEDEEHIVDIIKVTKVSCVKLDKIEYEIIKDADLDNLGRDDFFEKSRSLYKEYNNILKKSVPSFEDFLASTYQVFKNFEFYTDTQKKERLAKWKENLNILKQLAKKGKICKYFDECFTF